MFGIGLGELILTLLLMVIFIKPRDIPSVVNFILLSWHKICSFVQHVHAQISRITSEIDNTENIIEDTFHDRIEKLRLKINEEPDFFEYEEDNKKRQPKLNLPTKKISSTSKKKEPKIK